MPETTALGAAMAAGAAEGVSVWSLNPEDLSEVTSEKFEPQINTEGTARPRRRRRRPDGSCVFAESEFRYARWKKAVQKSMNWETTEPVANGNGTQLQLPQSFADESSKHPGKQQRSLCSSGHVTPGESSIFSSAPLGFYLLGSMLMLVGAKYLAGGCRSPVCLEGMSLFLTLRRSSG